MGAVSFMLVDLSCFGAGREPYRLIYFLAFTVDALETGYHYSLNQGADLCLCNTIAYSLYSACDGCQGSGWIRYG